MAEQGAIAAGEDRRHFRRVRGAEPAETVDAAMDRPQPPSPDPVVDGVLRHSGRDELAPGQHAMLPRRREIDDLVDVARGGPSGQGSPPGPPRSVFGRAHGPMVRCQVGQCHG
jgi:hypothetical protein